MSTARASRPVTVRGADVRVGDLLVCPGGRLRRVARIEPYEGALADLLGPGARTAHEDGPDEWVITLDGSRHPGYEVVRDQEDAPA